VKKFIPLPEVYTDADLIACVQSTHRKHLTYTRPDKIIIPNDPDLKERLVDKGGLAKILKIDRARIPQLMRDSNVPRFTVGTKALYDPKEVIEHLRRLRRKARGTKKDEEDDLEEMAEYVKDIPLVGPIKIRCDFIQTCSAGSHTFFFGKAAYRLPRSQYEIVHIDQLDNELGMWYGVTMFLEARLVDLYNLRYYAV